MGNKAWCAGLGPFSLALSLAAAFPSAAYAAQEFPQGVYVGGQNMGGLTLEEAQAAVEQYVAAAAGREVTLDMEDVQVTATADAMGFHWDNPDVVLQASRTYKGGSLVKQYLVKKDLEKKPARLAVETSVDAGKIEAFVNERSQEAYRSPRNASIRRENGQFIITDEEAGRAIDAPATAKALKEALETNPDRPVKVSAVFLEQQPQITRRDLVTIQDVLGTYTTNFSGSQTARSTNLAVGAGKINGFLLMPGAVLSGYERLQPFTPENGYQTAPTYENGHVVDSVGGGVCQIATTLYNAALLAEMNIVERASHSMVVGYVEPSMDAAIAGTFKDIKISNNYATPVYIEAYALGGKLTFTIYGKETRPANRRIAYISEVLSVKDPGEPQLVADPALPPGKRIKVQSSHKGKKARLWKCVYVDGVETERSLLHTDTYQPSKAIYRVGPAEALAAPMSHVLLEDLTSYRIGGAAWQNQ